MQIAHRHPAAGALQWTVAMNLFSLVFSLLLAIGIIVALLFLFASQEPKTPPAPEPPTQTAQLRGTSILDCVEEVPC